jgi:hypothetical protein
VVDSDSNSETDKDGRIFFSNPFSLFGSSRYGTQNNPYGSPFGSYSNYGNNYNNYNSNNYGKTPVLLNGGYANGKKVGVLGNKYLFKLASTTRNPDGSLSGAVYPEVGGGIIFNTPAGNANNNNNNVFG